MFDSSTLDFSTLFSSLPFNSSIVLTIQSLPIDSGPVQEGHCCFVPVRELAITIAIVSMIRKNIIRWLHALCFCELFTGTNHF